MNNDSTRQQEQLIEGTYYDAYTKTSAGGISRSYHRSKNRSKKATNTRNQMFHTLSRESQERIKAPPATADQGGLNTASPSTAQCKFRKSQAVGKN